MAIRVTIDERDKCSSDYDVLTDFVFVPLCSEEQLFHGGSVLAVDWTSLWVTLPYLVILCYFYGDGQLLVDICCTLKCNQPEDAASVPQTWSLRMSSV
jgi:hypothetical protein